MEIFIKILQFVFSLSILVLIHEFGHFLAARAFNTKVEKFYLFFNPWFSLFKFKHKDTEYGVGWLPLGGYVKIAGMIDESMDKEQLKKEPEPWEFRSKPAWQRLIIMLGGVIMNVFLAFLIYIFMLFIWGQDYLPTNAVKYGIHASSTDKELGLQNGDKIISLDGHHVEEYHKIPFEIILNQYSSIQVERDQEIIDLLISSDFRKNILNKQATDFLSITNVNFPFEARKIVKNSAAENAGFKEGDQLISINEIPTPYFQDFFEELQNHKEKEVNISFIRDGHEMTISVMVPSEGKIGIYPQSLDQYFNFKKIEYSFFEAVPAGFSKTIEELKNYVKQLKILINPDTGAYKSVGGFITIGSIFPDTWDWHVFWKLTALLSIMLAILNILPIPALDGGHVLFLLVEIITQRKPSDKFLEYAQIVGMVILFGLLILANGNDIIRYFF